MATKTFVDGATLSASDMNTYCTNAVQWTYSTTPASSSNVLITDIFSSSYNYYTVILSNVTDSASGNLFVRGITSGAPTGLSTSVYFLGGRTIPYAGAASDLQTSGGSSWVALTSLTTTGQSSVRIDVIEPFSSSKYTTVHISGNSPTVARVASGSVNVTTSITGLSLVSSSSGNIGCDVAVYGYRVA